MECFCYTYWDGYVEKKANFIFIDSYASCVSILCPHLDIYIFIYSSKFTDYVTLYQENMFILMTVASCKKYTVTSFVQYVCECISILE